MDVTLLADPRLILVMFLAAVVAMLSNLNLAGRPAAAVIVAGARALNTVLGGSAV